MTVRDYTERQLKSLPPLTDGGEAYILELDRDQLVKIFKVALQKDHELNPVEKKFKDELLRTKEKKVETLLQARAQSSGIVLPTELVRVDGKFAGYVMKRALNVSPLNDFTKKRFVEGENVTNLEVLKLVESIGETLQRLHNNPLHIIIGDVSARNIIVSTKASRDGSREVYFIDSDSWGIRERNLLPDAYTDPYIPPETIKSKGNGRVALSRGTDRYGYAVLAFYILTRLHPFGGRLDRMGERMSEEDRMRYQISVLSERHKKEIKLPPMAQSWQWMGKELLDGFLQVFEKGNRDSILPLIKDQIKNSKKCSKCGIYYHGRYDSCSVCNPNARYTPLPKPKPPAPPPVQKPAAQPVQKPDSAAKANPPKAGASTPVSTPAQVASPPVNLPPPKLVLDNDGVKSRADKDSYTTSLGQVIHRPSGRTALIAFGDVYFVDSGRYILDVSKLYINVHDANNELTRLDNIMLNSSYAVGGNKLFYVDKSGVLQEVTMSSAGLSYNSQRKYSKPLLAANSKGELFVLECYDDRLVAHYGGRTAEVAHQGGVAECAIKCDEASGTWALIFGVSSGKHRIVVFGNTGVIHDREVARFAAKSLSNLSYAAGKIYGPEDGKIVGTNIATGNMGSFACSVVDPGSRLEFESGGFNIITTDNKLYRFG